MIKQVILDEHELSLLDWGLCKLHEWLENSDYPGSKDAADRTYALIKKLENTSEYSPEKMAIVNLMPADEIK